MKQHGKDMHEARDTRRARGEAALVALGAGVVAVIGILGVWLASENALRADYRHYLTSLAAAAAQQIDPTLHNALRRPEQRNGPDYQRAVAPLRRMHVAVPDLLFIYTVVRDGAAVRFVLDAADPGDHDGNGLDDQAQIWEICDAGDPALQVALGDGRKPGHAAATDHVYTDRWGTFLTGWAPIIDSSGRQLGALGVDVDAAVYLQRIATARRWALLGLLPACLLVIGLGMTYYYNRLRRLTATRKAAKALRDSARASRRLAVERARLNQLVESAGVATWEWHVDSGRTEISQRWSELVGMPIAELLPFTVERWQGLLHSEDVAVAMATVGSLAEPGPDQVRTLDYRMRHAAGHWVWISARGTVSERDAAGRPLVVAGIALDVSGSKLAEQALQDSERQFRGLFELSQTGILLTDLVTGQILRANDALVEQTGYSRKQLLGLTFRQLAFLSNPADARKHREDLLAMGQNGPLEMECERSDRSRYPVLISSRRMTNAAGRDIVWSIVQDVSQRRAMEQSLADAARRDRLTGLANRAQLVDRLQAAIMRVTGGSQLRFAVLFLDFDRFKYVNDSMGHDAGDELLRQIAVRLRGSLRASDTLMDNDISNVVARFGGDEFVILVNDLKAGADPSGIAERLLNNLAPSYSINGRDVYSTASIGIVSSEQCTESADAVIRNADVAMYEAKRAGRACCVVFNEAMHTRLARHLTVENSLRAAIGGSQLSLVYQPIIDLESGKMVSAEALIRWQHPTLGDISPTEFIPIAEESGLIVAIGEQVLLQACTQLASWQREAPEHAPRTISVNVSHAELGLGDRLLERVHTTLAKTGVAPQCLQLEITEREFMRDPAATCRLMQQLRDSGVGLAMDDFGTGTSSLSGLRNFPFSTIKIDRSFLTNITSSRDMLAVIHATVALIGNLGMTSVAEGVEEAAQVAILQSMNCSYAQGYYFSRPLPPGELLDFSRRALATVC